MKDILSRIPKHKQPLFISACIILITIGTGIFFRLYPITHNISRKNQNIARLTIYVNIRKALEKRVIENYPDLNKDQKRALVDEQFRKTLTNEAENVQKLITQSNLDIFKPYLLGADSYYYYYLTKKLVTGGIGALKFKNGKSFDSLIMAPLGFWRNAELHPYTGFLTYKFLRFFNKGITLIQAVSVIPLLLYALSACLFIAICNSLKIKKAYIFLSGISFSLAPIFLQRSSFGWYDSDPYNVIFLMLTLLLTLKIMQFPKPYKWTIALSLLHSLYSLFWQGWALLPAASSLFFISIIIYRFVTKKTHMLLLKQYILYLIAMFFFLTLILTPAGIIESLKDIASIFSRFSMNSGNNWPDMFVTVGELKATSFKKLLHILGGPGFFLLSLGGLIALFFSKKSETQKGQIIVVSFFYVFFLIMAKSAERFIIFFLAPASLTFAIGLNNLMQILKRICDKQLRYNYIYPRIVAPFIFCAFLTISLGYGHISSLKQNPVFNPIWDSALNKVRTNTPKDSIINSWWSPGHFIKAIAERGVAFDGATLNTPVSYWMASFFLETNEDRALATLRMINTSGNTATEFLLKNGLRLDKAIALIKKVLSQNRETARKTLQNNLSEEKADYILSLTHATAPPSYCLIYNGLIDNTLGLYFAKNWNFTKLFRMKQQGNAGVKGGIFWRGMKKNIAYLWAVSGGPTYIGKIAFQTTRHLDTVSFSNTVELNTSTMEATIHSLNDPLMLNGRISGKPQRILYIRNGRLIRKETKDFSTILSILFIPQPNEKYACVVAPEEVLTSVIFRLYYLEGLGLKNFEKIIEEDDARFNTKILVYKISWPE